jgi:hypothetical protein
MIVGTNFLGQFGVAFRRCGVRHRFANSNTT